MEQFGIPRRTEKEIWAISQHPHFKKGHPPTKKKTVIPATEEELYSLYWDEHLTLCQIAKEFGVSKDIIVRIFKDSDIPVRSVKDAAELRAKENMKWRENVKKNAIFQKGHTPWNKGKDTGVIPWNRNPGYQFITREELFSLYWDEGKSLSEIADRFDVTPQSIHHRFEKYDIPMRSYLKGKPDDKVRAKIIKSLHASPNKPERKLIEIIQKNMLPFKFVGNGEVMLGGYNPDFINVNGNKQIIEVFGRYWHQERKEVPYTQTVKGRTKIFAQYGFSTLILWDDEINTLPEDVIVKKITSFELP